ncbi:MAG: hypothetical protein GXO55_07345, partial [Chloroflexi bacterium]|nr:hypothetical protein [Chloroflexota bacterium]
SDELRQALQEMEIQLVHPTTTPYLLPNSTVGLAQADAAIAETGTLVFQLSSQKVWRTLLVPSTLIILVHAQNIFPAWDEWVRQEAQLPAFYLTGRTTTYALSRTPLPAHGPQDIHVILIAEEPIT